MCLVKNIFAITRGFPVSPSMNILINLCTDTLASPQKTKRTTGLYQKFTWNHEDHEDCLDYPVQFPIEYTYSFWMNYHVFKKAIQLWFKDYRQWEFQTGESEAVANKTNGGWLHGLRSLVPLDLKAVIFIKNKVFSKCLSCSFPTVIWKTK